MSVKTLKDLYLFELENLRKEISAYKKEQNLWLIQAEVNNSAGNLCLHLTGNIQHFIGTLIGKTDYIRNREAEFNDKHQSKADLLKEIEVAMQVASATFDKMSEADLTSIYPIDFMGVQTTDFYLTRFLAHLSYHLGQISYHRRLLDK